MTTAVTPQQVYSVIEQCVFSPFEQQEAMKILQAFESHDNYVISLTEIVKASDVPTIKSECRLMAVIMLKNIASKHWKNRGGNAKIVANTEKEYLKDFLSNCHSESEKRISIQLAVLIAKVARHDWPGEWPNLFLHIGQSLSSNDISLRILILKELLTELQNKRDGLTKSSLCKVCVDLFPIITELWQTRIEILMRHVSGSSEAAVDSAVDQAAVLSQLASLALDQAYESLLSAPHTAQYVHKYLTQITTVVPPLLLWLRSTAKSDGAGTVNCVRASVDLLLMRDLAQLPLSMLKNYPLHSVTVDYLLPWLNFFANLLMQEYSSVPVISQCESFGIAAVSFMSKIATCGEYTVRAAEAGVNVSSMARRLQSRGAAVSEADEAASVARADTIRKSFFQNSDTVLALLNLMLSALLRHNAAELEEWASDPEQFYVAQQGLTASETVKTCAEGLFVGLLELCPSVVLGHLAALLQDTNRQVQAASPPTESAMQSHSTKAAWEVELFHWDAVYLMTGLAVGHLSEHIDINQWLNQALGSTLQQVLSTPGAGTLRGGQQLLRVRMLWLLPCWSYYFSPDTLSQLLGLLLTVLKPDCGSDMVATLQALNSLQALLSTPAFRSSMILGQVPDYVHTLCGLVETLEEIESKAQVVGIIGQIVDSMTITELKPLLGTLVSCLGNLWTSSSENISVRSPILMVMTVVVKRAGASVDQSLHALALPLVSVALSSGQTAANSTDADTGEVTESHLLAEGLSLWVAIARNSTSYTQALDAVLKSAVPQLFRSDCAEADRSGDSGVELDCALLQEMMLVAEAYAIVGGAQCLLSAEQVMHQLFQSTLGHVAPRAVQFVTRPLEAFLLVCPDEAARFLSLSHCLEVMLKTCCSHVEGLKDQMKIYHEPDIVVVCYLSVIARLVLCSTNTVVGACAALVSGELTQRGIVTAHTDPSQLLKSIVRLMLDKFDCVGYCNSGAWRRKMWVLALLTLLTHSGAVLVEWAGEIMTCADGVLCEASTEEGKDKARSLASALLIRDEDDCEVCEVEKELGREREAVVCRYCELLERDIVNRSDVKTCVRAAGAGLQISVGAAVLSQVLASLDPSVLSRISS